MKVCYLTNIPSPYRVDYFNELGKYCELTVFFEKRRSNERNVEWGHDEFKTFKGVFLDGISVATDAAFSLKGIAAVKKNKYDIVISTNYHTPTGILQIVKMKLLNIPYFIEADGGVDGTGNGVKEKLKRKILEGAKLYFSTSEACDKYFLTYGANKEQLRRYPFTSIHRCELVKSIVTKEQKNTLRDELGIAEEKVILSVGRFSYQNGYGKGFDTLVRVCEALPKEFGVYIVGDEPTKEFIELKKSKNLTNLHYVSFKIKNEVMRYFQAADISVLLSRGEAWGLVINESMSNSTPVIATRSCIAGLELIKHGENGYLVDVDDDVTIKKFLMGFFSDNEKRCSMQKACLRTAQEYTIQAMAEKHIEIFKDYYQNG